MSRQGLDEAQKRIQEVLDQVMEKHEMTSAETLGLLVILALNTYANIDEPEAEVSEPPQEIGNNLDVQA